MICFMCKMILVSILYVDSAIAACSNACVSCSDATCTQCESSFYLAGGNCNSCPVNCQTCVDYNKCSSCEPTHWGLDGSDTRCQQQCTSYCKNQHCDDTTGNCIECREGSYGLKCLRACTLCENEQCGLRACTLGCKSGYYAFNDGTETYCQSCPQKCAKCNSFNTCDICNDGYYQYKYTGGDRLLVNCIPCTGFPTPCPNSCAIENCNNCQVLDGNSLCTECVNGYRFNGETCIPNPNNCSQGCSTDCNEEGDCLDSCNDGWTGGKCFNRCDDSCAKCRKDDRAFCEQCNGDFYSTACSLPCPNNCRISAGEQTCRTDDGYCLNGCDRRFWGDLCTEPCSNGCFDDVSSQLCDRNNGACTNRCKEGYSGDKCETVITLELTTIGSKASSESHTPTPQNSDDSSTGAVVKEKNDSNVIIIGAGAGGGAVVLILIVVMVVCLVKRRGKAKHKHNADKDDKTVAVAAHNVGDTDDIANLYAKPMKLKKEPKTETNQEYIYAQPNKPKKAKTHSKKEIGDPQRLYDNIAIDLEDEQTTTAETSVDMLQLESLDEGAISFIETEVKVPTADVYYNTTSLVRSRIQVSNLLEYVKMKTDYQKEFENLPKGLTRPCSEALKPKNISKNRYNGIYAYDATRVVLKSSKIYVNANYIDGHRKSPEYIASLGPTRAAMNKFEAFWEMIWQEKTEAIVMLTHLEESGKMKCEQYWPEKGMNAKYGEYNVLCTTETDYSEFVGRELNIKWKSETRKVMQYHYTAWPDKTVPESVASLLEFRDKVEQTRSDSAGPMVVHCSAGIGRTGTYIALDILIQEGRKEKYVDIFGCVTGIRGQRAHMVQNLEQYIYLHHCVLYALTCDPQPRSDTAIQRMTGDSIEEQYQAFMELPLLRSKDRKSMAINNSRKENRKRADVPGDNHRVRLKLTKQNHINVVYVNGYLKPDKFILVQTPLPNTVEQFVSMLYQEQCACVISLDEEHIHEQTVGQYLPPANKVLVFGQFQVSCKRSESKEDFIVRELNISRNGSPSHEAVTTLHYQFRGWEDSASAPPNVTAFLKLILDTEKSTKAQNTDKPIVVHCLDGTERSSVFCAVSIILEKFAIEKEVSAINTVSHIRTRRQSAFQDIEQFRFCYNCWEEISRSPDKSDYYNIVKI